MDMKRKSWLIIGAACVLIGCIVFGGVMMALRWDFSKLSTVKFETNEYQIRDPYENITVVAETADIVFLSSGGTDTVVSCYEETRAKHTVSVTDGTLNIRIQDKTKWYEKIDINFGMPKIVITLPRGQYGTLVLRASTGDTQLPEELRFQSVDITHSTGDVTCKASAQGAIQIKTSTGDIRLENMSAGVIDLRVSTGHIRAAAVSCPGDIFVKVSTGKTELTDVICKNFTSTGSTGDIIMENMVAGEKFSIQRNTGDVTFEGCDAAEIFVETSTGHVTGWLLSEKTFRPETDTGKIVVPMTVTGGLCRIVTDTGDIKIDVRHS